MPRTARSRRLASDPVRTWELAADPAKLPRWWPGVDRVDRRSADSFTKWVVSPRGRSVPMTFTLGALDEGTRVRWEQDLEGSAFARSLRSAAEEISVTPREGGSTVELVIERRMRGTARLGSLLVARGQRKELDRALDRLQERLDG